MSSTVNRFRITLQGIEPEIWRQIQVPRTYTFWDLHVAIQDAMGWLDYHLHEFRITNPQTGQVDAIGIPSEDDLGFGPPTLPGWEIPTARYFTNPTDRAEYSYDFGDGWEHTVVLEETLDVKGDQPAIACVAGERACPPEDCGGIFGYQELLDAMSDSRHTRRRELMEWLGGKFDAEEFAPSQVQFDDPAMRWKGAFGGAV